jgi:hypothetical protein
MTASEPGDLAYLFAKFFYKVWEKTPRWTTYHNLEKLLAQPSINEEYERMVNKLSMSTHFGRLDIQVAARAALNELFWRCVRGYENGKKVANGDLFGEGLL